MQQFHFSQAEVFCCSIVPARMPGVLRLIAEQQAEPGHENNRKDKWQ